MKVISNFVSMIKFELILTNRESAGSILSKIIINQLKAQLPNYQDNIKEQIVVLGIPNGGFIVAKKVAEDLGIKELGMIISKRILDQGENHVIGSILLPINKVKSDLKPNIIIHIDKKTIRNSFIPKCRLRQILENRIKEVEKISEIYKPYLKEINLENKIIILIDDGMASGSTSRISLQYIRKYNPQLIVFAIPIAPKKVIDSIATEFRYKPDIIATIKEVKDEKFISVEKHYKDFKQISAEEIVQIIK